MAYRQKGKDLRILDRQGGINKVAEEIKVSISAVADGRKIYGGTIRLRCNDGITESELTGDLCRAQVDLANTWLHTVNVETTSWYDYWPED